jgi:hypothetical protein
MSDNATPDVSDVLGASGACPEIVVGEGVHAKKWVIGWPIQTAKTRLRKLLIGIAEENIRESCEGLSPAFVKHTMKSFTDAVRDGEYKTWGAGWLAAYNTPRGQLMFLLSLLQENHPHATEADAIRLFRDKGEEVTLALLCVAPPFFSILMDDLDQMRLATEEEALRFKTEMVGQAMTAIRGVLTHIQTQRTPTTPTDAK